MGEESFSDLTQMVDTLSFNGEGCLLSKKTAGKVLTCRAAVAWGPKQPLVIEEIQVDPPKAMEVRIKITHTSLCQTDIALWHGEVERLQAFPRIFGHEGAG